MIESRFTKLTGLSADEIELVDQICERFEQSWIAGEPESIESLAENHSGTMRHFLVNELVKLDVDYRRHDGQNPVPEEYLQRLPDDAESIAVAFNESNDDTARSAQTADSESRFAELSARPLTLSSDYEILEFKARGGLGEVYIALDKRLGRKVAIKVSRNPNPDSTDRLRLRREAEITSCLKHPGIVPVHAATFDTAAAPAYVMQLVEGTTFRNTVLQFHERFEGSPTDRFQVCEFRRLVQSLLAVCNTVAYAHGQNVIHRDIKPSNIMLGTFGESILLDWGLAKTLKHQRSSTNATSSSIAIDSDRESWRTNSDETAATDPGQPIGTPEFASPEQVAGRVDDHDVRSDVYSLGATMYYLLVGQRPEATDDFLDHQSNSATVESFKPPRSINPSVPVDLNAVCMKAMAFTPDNRYQDATELANELDRFLADEPVLVRTPSIQTRIRRWITKNPRWVSGIATGTLVALIALAIGGWLLGQKHFDLRNSNESLVYSNKQLDLARKKTTTVLQTVTDHAMNGFLGREQLLEDQDKTLLNEILKDYQSFAESITDDKLSVEVEMEAHFRIGQIQSLLGSTAEANESMQRTIDLFHDHPMVRTYPARYRAAISNSKSGEYLFKLGERDRGIQLLRESAEMLQQLQTEVPEIPERQYNAAKSRTFLAVAYHELRLFKQAEEQNVAAIETLETLLENDPGNRGYQQTLATFLTNLGIGYSATRRADSAATVYYQALEIYQQLLEHGADQFGIRFKAAKTTLALCSVLNRLKRADETEKLLTTLVAECNQLTTRFPRIPVNFITQARAHKQLGVIYLFRQLYPECLFHTQLAVSAAEKAVELEPDLDKYIFTMLFSRMDLALALRLSGALSDSHVEYEKCLQTARDLLAKFGDFKHRLALARVHYAFGQLLLKMEERPNAISHMEEAISILESGTESEQQLPPLQKLLRTSSKVLAQELIKEDRNTDAVEHWDRVIELTDGNTVFFQTVRAVCTADADPELALERVAQILESGAEKRDALYNLSCASARSARFLPDGSLQDNALDQAFELLEKCREMGYFKNEKERIQRLKGNNSFIWLNRENDSRFQEFVEELEKQQDTTS